jgi:hypothetical protein
MVSTDTPPFLLRWSDDCQSVSYDDRLTITMGQFRTLPDVALREAKGSCDTLNSAGLAGMPGRLSTSTTSNKRLSMVTGHGWPRPL